jgi:hypothetical protein
MMIFCPIWDLCPLTSHWSGTGLLTVLSPSRVDYRSIDKRCDLVELSNCGSIRSDDHVFTQVPRPSGAPIRDFSTFPSLNNFVIDQQ